MSAGSSECYHIRNEELTSHNGFEKLAGGLVESPALLEWEGREPGTLIGGDGAGALHEFCAGACGAVWGPV